MRIMVRIMVRIACTYDPSTSPDPDEVHVRVRCSAQQIVVVCRGALRDPHIAGQPVGTARKNTATIDLKSPVPVQVDLLVRQVGQRLRERAVGAPWPFQSFECKIHRF